jgi:hypothetical protein
MIEIEVKLPELIISFQYVLKMLNYKKQKAIVNDRNALAGRRSARRPCRALGTRPSGSRQDETVSSRVHIRVFQEGFSWLETGVRLRLETGMLCALECGSREKHDKLDTSRRV